MLYFDREKVRFFRAAANIPTQGALAAAMGTSEPNLSRMLCGRAAGFSTAMLSRMCEVLMVQPGQVLFYAPSLPEAAEMPNRKATIICCVRRERLRQIGELLRLAEEEEPVEEEEPKKRGRAVQGEGAG